MDSLGQEPGFREAYARELVASERLRSLALVAVFAFVTAIVAVSALSGSLATAVYERAWGAPVYLWAIALTGFALVYELFVWRVLRGRERVPAVFPYVTTLVEMLLPTGVLLAFSAAIDPTHAVGAPPLLLYTLLIVLAALHVDERVCVFAGAVAAVHYLALYATLVATYEGHEAGTFLTEPAPHYIRGVLLAATGIAAAFVTWDIKKRLINSFELQRENRRVLAVLGEQVSAPVAEALIREEGDGRVRRICVVFLDIRDFTGFAENRAPGETVQFLNEIFEPMIRTINAHHGVINKFLGDGFMAIFGRPFTEGNPSEAAVAASLEIVEDLADAGTVRVGIGLHTGEAVTGNIGSGLRKEYTVIGDVVNLAARIEQLTKEYGAQILVSSDVWNDLRDPPPSMRRVDGVRVKGRDEPIAIHQLA